MIISSLNTIFYAYPSNHLYKQYTDFQKISFLAQKMILYYKKEKAMDRTKKIFLLIGGPGSGKTSTAKSLDIQELTHFSIGEMYRKIANGDTQLSKLIKNYIDKGNIVPLDIAENIIKIFLEKGKEIILIDGFPRSFEQAIMFDRILLSEHYKLEKVIEIITNKDIALKRIIGRNRGIDDKKELFEYRFAVYNKDIQKLRKHYQQKGCYIQINGNNSLESTVNNLKKVIIKTL